MQKNILPTLSLLIIVTMLAAVETAVAIPIVTLSLVTTFFSKQPLWGQLLLLSCLSLVLSSCLHTSWFIVYCILLIIPAVTLLRRKAATELLPLPLVFVISMCLAALLSIVASVQLTLSTAVYSVIFSVVSYSCLHLVRSRQKRRRLVEWFWVSS